MAQSVGMFQRPVEYRVNCLEFTYPFSGLNLSYISLILGVVGEPFRTTMSNILNYSYEMSYSGFVKLIACGSGVDESGKTLIKVKPSYFVNTIHTINELRFDVNYDNMFGYIDQAHQTALSSFNARLNFYEEIKDFIKSKAVENGLDKSKFDDYNIIFDFSGDYRTGEFYYANGSSINYIDRDEIIIAVGVDEFGVTLWDYPGIGLFGSRLKASGVYLDGAIESYFDPLVYEGEGNILHPIHYYSMLRSEKSINDFYNYYKDRIA